MKDYDRNMRPVPNPSEVVMVNMSLSLVQLLEVDDKSQVITMSIWLYQIWNDYRLQWNPDDYGGLNYVLIKAKDMWYPDTGLYLSAKEQQDQHPYVITDWFLLRVHSTGKVAVQSPHCWYIPCNVDVTSFPNDHQHCDISVGQWSHTAEQVDYISIFDEIKKELYIASNSWEVSGSATEKGYSYDIHSGGPYAYINFVVYLDRKPLFYLLNLCIPSVLLSFLSSLVFYFPPNSPDKIPHGLSVLLTIFIFDILVIDIMPASSDKIPVTTKYLFINMIFTVIAIIVSAILINVYKLEGRFSDRKRASLIVLASILRISLSGKYIKKQKMKIAKESVGIRIKEYDRMHSIIRRSDRYNGALPTNVHHGSNDNTELGFNKDIRVIKDRLIVIQKKLEDKFNGPVEEDLSDSDWKLLSYVLNRVFFIILMCVNFSVSLWTLLIGTGFHSSE
ncbi:neuronal acetylcholine receptor subunit alpha-3-like [Ptychodera flava]|uniref:neuronal acetylcholine receptor subunit alpha-3-like n=1 Tax=Ptychodera flava TaxID=63121 RepID=UPI00396A3283